MSPKLFVLGKSKSFLEYYHFIQTENWEVEKNIQSSIDFIGTEKSNISHKFLKTWRSPFIDID